MKAPSSIEGFISNVELGLLMHEASMVKPGGVIVEIGSYYGKSTVAMSMAAKAQTQIYAIDTWNNEGMGTEGEKDTYAKFLSNTKDLANINPRRGMSKEIGKEWHTPIDLLFVDGDHAEGAVFSDLFIWACCVKDGGTILMHDYTEKCGVRPAWEMYAQTYMKDKKTDVIASILRIRI